jgi:predicted nucleotidyltransferase
MLNKDYREMLQLLSEEGAEFIIVGAYAMAVHGYPRATGDIDIWVKASEANSLKVYQALKRFGAPLEHIKEKDFLEKDIIFQIGVSPRRIDIITGIDGVSYKEAEKDITTVEIGGLKLPVISLENLIKNKKAAGREKDIIDVRILERRLNNKEGTIL